MIKIISKLFTLVLLVVPLLAYAQKPAPAPAQSQPIAIMNATAHVGNGQVINNAIITCEGGKITLVADATCVRVDLKGYQVIAASGKHVYPGLISPSTNVGLVEVASVRASNDHTETGNVNPNVRSIIAYNADSDVIPTLRFNGVLMAQTTPQGGIVSGTSSVVQLDAWNWEDAAYKTDDGIHMNWPRKTLRPRWWLGETTPRPNEQYKPALESIDQLFADARAYIEVVKPAATNLKLEAMRGLFDGTKKLYIHTNGAKAIVAAVQNAKDLGVQQVVIVGGGDAHMITDFLKEHEVPVILANVHRLPSRAEDDVDLPYKLPALLHNAGVLVALGHDSYTNSRNLAFFAGTAAAYGLDKEQALQLVTANTAKILGIDQTVGTLEAGKDATMVVSTGDLLDMRTNNIEHAFIQGRQVQTEGKQQYLYNQYKQKFQGQK